MKYSQFLQLSEIADKQGKPIVNILEKLELNEATGETPEKGIKDIETEKTTLAGRAVSRWVRMKNKLNKVGKDTQKQLVVKVLKKYLPTMLSNEKKIVQKMEKPADTEQLQNLVNSNYKQIKDQQDKQMNVINTAVDNFLKNVSKKMNIKIDSSQMSDTNKVRLKNYWLLLTTQISMNSYFYIINERGKLIDSIFKGDKKASQTAKNEVFKDEYEVLNKKKKIVNTKKEEVAKEGKEAEAEEKTEKPEETKAESSAEGTEIKPEIGKKYIYTNDKGEKTTIEATKENEDGTFDVKEDNGKTGKIGGKMLKKLSNIETEQSKTKPVTQEYPDGKKYKFYPKTKEGKPSKKEMILKIESFDEKTGKYTVSYPDMKQIGKKVVSSENLKKMLTESIEVSDDYKMLSEEIK